MMQIQLCENKQSNTKQTFVSPIWYSSYNELGAILDMQGGGVTGGIPAESKAILGPVGTCMRPVQSHLLKTCETDRMSDNAWDAACLVGWCTDFKVVFRFASSAWSDVKLYLILNLLITFDVQTLSGHHRLVYAKHL